MTDVDLAELAFRLAAERDQAWRERDEARAFAEKAAQQYNELLAAANAARVTCAFCGEEYPRGTPRHGDGELAEHIRSCEQHPMRAVERERDELAEQLADLRWRMAGLEK